MCDVGLRGLIIILISSAISGILFTVLVWCNSHTWIYFKHKGRYIKVIGLHTHLNFKRWLYWDFYWYPKGRRPGSLHAAFDDWSSRCGAHKGASVDSFWFHLPETKHTNTPPNFSIQRNAKWTAGIICNEYIMELQFTSTNPFFEPRSSSC